MKNTQSKGRIKAIYQLEEMAADEKEMMEALGIIDFHEHRPKIKGVGVYS